MKFTLRQETISSKSVSYAGQSMLVILIMNNQPESELMDEALQRQVLQVMLTF